METLKCIAGIWEVFGVIAASLAFCDCGGALWEASDDTSSVAVTVSATGCTAGQSSLFTTLSQPVTQPDVGAWIYTAANALPAAEIEAIVGDTYGSYFAYIAGGGYYNIFTNPDGGAGIGEIALRVQPFCASNDAVIPCDQWSAAPSVAGFDAGTYSGPAVAGTVFAAGTPVAILCKGNMPQSFCPGTTSTLPPVTVAAELPRLIASICGDK